MSCEGEGRDWDDHLQGKKCQRLPANHQNLGEETETVFMTALKRTSPSDTCLDREHLPARTMRQ